jgi:hypothetical protein
MAGYEETLELPGVRKLPKGQGYRGQRGHCYSD